MTSHEKNFLTTYTTVAQTHWIVQCKPGERAAEWGSAEAVGMGGTIRAVRQRDLKPTSRQGLGHFLCLRIWILRKARGLETSHDRHGRSRCFCPTVLKNKLNKEKLQGASLQWTKQIAGGITREEHASDKQQRSQRPRGCGGRVCADSCADICLSVGDKDGGGVC